MVPIIRNACAALLLVATPTMPPTYAISGIVRDTSRHPVGAVRIEVVAPGFEGRFVVSESSGRYRIHDLSGGVQLYASKDGYFSDIRAVSASDDGVVDFILQPHHRIEIGNPIREALTSDYPLCVSRDYADRGLERRGVLCHRFSVTATMGGTLEVVLLWDPRTRLALDLIAPDGRSVQSFDGVGRTSLTTIARKDSTYEVRVLAHRELAGYQDFELRAAMK